MKTLFLFLLVGMTVGCAAKEAKITPSPLVSTGPAEFELPDQDLKNNRIFFWKENATTDQVKAVLKNSEGIDRLEGRYIELKNTLDGLESQLEALIKELKVEEAEMWTALSQGIVDLNEELVRLRKRVELKKKEQGTLTAKVAALGVELAAALSKIGEKQTALDQELAKPENEQNQELIKKLKEEIAVLVPQKDFLSTEVEAAKTKLATVEKTVTETILKISEGELEVNSLSEKRKTTFPVLTDKLAGKDVAGKTLEAFQEEATPKLENYLATIVDNVDEFTEIPMVRVKYTGLPMKLRKPNDPYVVQVTVDRWDNVEGNPHQTTGTFQRLGGRLEFEIVVDAKTYKFNVSRSKYDDPGLRIFYQGDVTLIENGKKRIGVAKFVDRNLN